MMSAGLTVLGVCTSDGVRQVKLEDGETASGGLNERI